MCRIKSAITFGHSLGSVEFLVFENSLLKALQSCIYLIKSNSEDYNITKYFYFK